MIANRLFIRCLYTTKSLKKPFETMSRLRHKQENRGNQLETYQVCTKDYSNFGHYEFMQGTKSIKEFA